MRLLALDQATRTTGYAIFIDGKLELHDKFTVDDECIGERLHKIREKIATLVMDYDIDYVGFEDIQLQEKVNGEESVNNVQTFKKLAEVFGVIYEFCIAAGVDYEIVSSNTWKSTCSIKGRQRDEQKRNAQEFVQKTYSVKCSQDEADAICIGTHICYANKIIKKPKAIAPVKEEVFDWS